MKLSEIFLAAVMIFSLAGTAAEARDHHGWWGHNNGYRSWNHCNNGFGRRVGFFNNKGCYNNHRMRAWDRHERKIARRMYTRGWY